MVSSSNGTEARNGSNALVVRELFGDITAAERRQLDNDPDEWLDDLAELIASLQSQLSRVNAELAEFENEVNRTLTAADANRSMAQRDHRDGFMSADRLAEVEEECRTTSLEAAEELSDEQARVLKWKASANAILSRAQARRRRVKRIVQERDQQRWERSNAAKVRAACEAIERHRREQMANDDEPSDADLDLWKWPERLRGGEFDVAAAS